MACCPEGWKLNASWLEARCGWRERLHALARNHRHLIGELDEARTWRPWEERPAQNSRWDPDSSCKSRQGLWEAAVHADLQWWQDDASPPSSMKQGGSLVGLLQERRARLGRLGRCRTGYGSRGWQQGQLGWRRQGLAENPGLRPAGQCDESG